MGEQPRRRDAEATRRELLEKATQHFVAKGFDGTRIDEIAAEAGINKRMLYVHFGNKEELYLEVLKTQLDRVLDIGGPPEARSPDPQLEAERIIRRYFYFLVENPQFVRLLGWELQAGARRAQRVIAERAIKGLEELHEVVRAGIAQGAFREDLDVGRLVLGVNALCVAHLTYRPLAEAFWKQDLSTPKALEMTLEQLLKLVFQGIRARPTRARAPKAKGTTGRAARGQGASK